MMKSIAVVLCLFISSAVGQLMMDEPRPDGLSWMEVCSLPSKVGLCRAAITKFYYDMESDKCEEFTYGGCGGNYNNFETKQECQDFCKKDKDGQVFSGDVNENYAPIERRTEVPEQVPENEYNPNASGSTKLKSFWPAMAGLVIGFYALLRKWFN